MLVALGWSVPVPFLSTLEASPLAVFAASLGAAATSLGVSGVTISSSSMSNTSVPVGRPGRSLYASSLGIQKRRFSPVTISCTPSLQPLMTLSTGNVAGSSRVTELSNILPSVVQPV